jgi:hypothetical protein
VRKSDVNLLYLPLVKTILEVQTVADSTRGVVVRRFTCIDLDFDNRIVASEMRYFYEEQLHRMECLSQEPVLFEDILCQLSDMVKPDKEGVFSLQVRPRSHYLRFNNNITEVKHGPPCKFFFIIVHYLLYYFSKSMCSLSDRKEVTGWPMFYQLCHNNKALVVYFIRFIDLSPLAGTLETQLETYTKCGTFCRMD